MRRVHEHRRDPERGRDVCDTPDRPRTAVLIHGRVGSDETVRARGADHVGGIDHAVSQLIWGASVGDLDRSIAWYGQLFGRPFDSRPMKEVAEWHVVPSGVVQLLDDPERAARSHLTLEVPDLERFVDGLSAVGATPERVDGGRFRTATVDDPDGNEITFVEVVDESRPASV